ncbi:MAG: transcriptional regulator [Candidatus Altiarchaeales archaeon]|nr:MAG: transcriptional regulator [Candidatus Altiarchaeales archaeon]
MQLPNLDDICRLRKKFGITQTELAKKAGVSQSLIARVEAGSVDPRYSKVVKIFKALEDIRGKGITAGEIMTKNVVGVQVEDPLGKATNKMRRYNVSQMPVFDKKKPVGSISEGVILDQISKGVDIHSISKKKVGEFMEDPFPSVNPKTTLSTISVLLENNKAVLLVEKGKIKGIVTNADLLKVVRS